MSEDEKVFGCAQNIADRSIRKEQHKCRRNLSKLQAQNEESRVLISSRGEWCAQMFLGLKGSLIG
jgi:hypothetical protein